MHCPQCGLKFDEMRMPIAWKARAELLDALERCNYNRTYVAKEMGVSLRTVRNWIAQLKAAGFHIKDSPKWRKHEANRV